MSSMAPSSEEPRSFEYLCTIQLPRGSTQALLMDELRCACARSHGYDDTCLYPPHITVTGYFQATPEQAETVCQELRGLVAERMHAGETFDVEVLGVKSAEGGRVILNMKAEEIARLGKELAERVLSTLGLKLRPKAARHVSLAIERDARVQASILDHFGLHEPRLRGFLPADIVIARRDATSDVARLQAGAAGHKFVELLRLPLQLRNGSAPHSEAASVPAVAAPPAAATVASSQALAPPPATALARVKST